MPTFITADPRILPSPRWPDSLPWWRRRLTHAVVIGSPALLRGIALQLAAAVDTLTLIAPDPAALRSLTRRAHALRKPALLSPRPVDSDRPADLTIAIRAAAADHGPITLAVASIRLPALFAAARAITESGPARLFHITHPLPPGPPPPLRSLPNLRYRRITLAPAAHFGVHPRPPTDVELTTPTIRAIELDALDTTVITPDPRPPNHT